MRTRWKSDASGIVYALSSIDVFSTFAETRMFNMIMNEFQESDFRCSVEFMGRLEPYSMENDESAYTVPIRYICGDSTGHITAKDYTILVSVAPVPKIEWSNRLDNPLGLVVKEYRVVSPEGMDPLDL
jgi:type IV secretory pathway component VirB8